MSFVIICLAALIWFGGRAAYKHVDIGSDRAKLFKFLLFWVSLICLGLVFFAVLDSAKESDRLAAGISIFIYVFIELLTKRLSEMEDRIVQRISNKIDSKEI